MIFEHGTIRDVAYAGMVTRYVVALERGTELQVVRQNLETSSQDALGTVGRQVRVGWRDAQSQAVREDRSLEEGR